MLCQGYFEGYFVLFVETMKCKLKDDSYAQSDVAVFEKKIRACCIGTCNTAKNSFSQKLCIDQEDRTKITYRPRGCIDRERHMYRPRDIERTYDRPRG